MITKFVAYKDGVVHVNNPALYVAIGMVAGYYDSWFGGPMVVTQILADYGSHAEERAFDVRRIDGYPSSVWEGFCKGIQAYYGSWIGVQLEPEWGKGRNYTAPHIHFQLKEG